MKLRDKVCIITGGAMGIGAAVAATFRKEGAYVFICDMNREAGEALAKELQRSQLAAGHGYHQGFPGSAGCSGE